MRGRFFYIFGCDGTGKTTHSRLFAEKLRSEGVKIKCLWMRFPFFFSIPLLLYARSKGYSWSEKISGHVYGYWDFSRSRILKIFLPWALLMDAFLASVIKIHIPLSLGLNIVCERYVFDMMADLLVAFGEESNLYSKIFALFPKLIPKNSSLVMLDLEIEAIHKRRPELSLDRNLRPRLAAFRSIAAKFDLTVIENNQPVSEVQQMLQQKLLGV